MSEIRVDSIGNESNTGGPVLSGITTFSGQQYFIPPSGTTAERPSDCPPGSIRFNTESAHLEYWNGLSWLEFEATSEEIGQSGVVGHRAVFCGGRNAPVSSPGALDVIDYFTVSTLGNAIDFGNLQGNTTSTGTCASDTRGLSGGGSGNTGGSEINRIDFITIASTGDAANFGDLTQKRGDIPGCCSSKTRGLWANGYDPASSINTIDYVTIASTGDAVDFGDTTFTGSYCAGTSSPVRGIFIKSTNCNYVTISSTGNAIDFGGLGTNHERSGAGSSATRGLFGGGAPGHNTITFITIATTGSAQDFGDLTVARRSVGGTSNSVRCLFAGANVSNNITDFVTIATTGNALDFGDLTVGRARTNGLCNGHGGL
jgi:hypothetical protein